MPTRKYSDLYSYRVFTDTLAYYKKKHSTYYWNTTKVAAGPMLCALFLTG